MPFDALTRLRDELVDLYGEDQIAGFQAMTARRAIGAWLQGDTTINNRLSFGESDPNEPGAVADYSISFRELLARCDPGGRHAKTTRARLIVFAYTLWENVYRRAIGDECGVASVDSDAFGDLRRYRHAILHNKGRLQHDPDVLSVFVKGDRVEPTADQLRAVFKQLVDALNDIGARYYGANPRFKWGHRLNK